MDNRLWLEFCAGHPSMHVTQTCLENVPTCKFWSLADHYSDLVSHLHIQVRLMGNLCLNNGIPWLSNTKGSFCFISKEKTEIRNHHLIDCPAFRSNSKTKIINCNQTDSIVISNFLTNLDSHQKVLLLLRGLNLLFDDTSTSKIKRFVASAVAKVHKLHTAKIRDLEATWPTK